MWKVWVMTEVSESAKGPRRWGAFVCPECRYVFRVSREYEGGGVVCPSCRRLLRLPGKDDETAPLFAKVRTIQKVE